MLSQPHRFLPPDWLLRTFSWASRDPAFEVCGPTTLLLAWWFLVPVSALPLLAVWAGRVADPVLTTGPAVGLRPVLLVLGLDCVLAQAAHAVNGGVAGARHLARILVRVLVAGSSPRVELDVGGPVPVVLPWLVIRFSPWVRVSVS